MGRRGEWRADREGWEGEGSGGQIGRVGRRREWRADREGGKERGVEGR